MSSSTPVSTPNGRAASPIPLYVQIEEELRGMIESGELGPLMQVPSELELAKRFGVSRMTARKAVDGLVGNGSLFRHPGKGTFVAAPKIAPSPFSTMLSFSAAMRSLGLKQSTQVLEQHVISAPSSIARALELAPGALVVYMRRLRIVEDEPVAIHIAYLPATYAGVLEGDLTGSLTDLLANLGVHVTESRDSVEAVAATSEDARLLKVPRHAPLIRIEGVAYTAARQAVRYTEALYRGDRIRLYLATNQTSDTQFEIKS